MIDNRREHAVVGKKARKACCGKGCQKRCQKGRAIMPKDKLINQPAEEGGQPALGDFLPGGIADDGIAYACKERNQGMHKIEKQGCIHGISSVHSVI